MQQSRSLPVLPVSDAHVFSVPVKKINEGQDVLHFLASRAYTDLMTFLLHLNRAMFPRRTGMQSNKLTGSRTTTHEINPQTTLSRHVKELQSLILSLEDVIDEVPAQTGPRRFGNVSFRVWCQKVEERAPELLDRHLTCLSPRPASDITLQAELLPYLLGSFGSAQRLDYGSGHELSFFAFLACIWKLGGFPVEGDISEDDQARGIVSEVFSSYLRLIRRLIKTYTLEPAGSHGVWGLDDHSFIPYIFGSAQYGPEIVSDASPTPTEGSGKYVPEPAEIVNMKSVEKYRQSNLYFGAIGFIHDVKSGPFWEHSPTLFDISGVKAGWGKINKGMIKMYNAEVLSKFPVVQHFPFGSLLSWERDPNALIQPVSVHTQHQLVGNGMTASLAMDSATARESHAGLVEMATNAGQAESSTRPTFTGNVARNPTHSDMRAPWTGRSTASLGAINARKQPPIPEQRNKMTVQSPPETSKSDHRRKNDQVSTKVNADPMMTSMPPPTRAPWAKLPE